MLFAEILLLVKILIAANGALAGGHVGNGAGIVEHNVFYAYELLPKAIQGCTTLSAACGLNEKNISDLNKILEIARRFPATAERLVFLSEKSAPAGFFDTDAGQAHRIAKTELLPHAPIYWNVDQLYRADGSAALDMPAIAALLIHELGHQAGIEDHAYLDQIGARVQVMLANGLPPILRFQDRNLGLELTVINYSSISATADIYVSDGKQSYRLGHELAKLAKCPAEADLLLGWKVVNQHWEETSLVPRGDSYATLPFSAWFQLYCLHGESLEESIQGFRLNFIFSQAPEQETKLVRVE